MGKMSIKNRIQEWWMCDFCGGMADPINFAFFIIPFVAFLIAAVVVFWRFL